MLHDEESNPTVSMAETAVKMYEIIDEANVPESSPFRPPGKGL
jgi:hypothetical protein